MPPQDSPHSVKHTIKQGDTLWDLAAEYYGSALLWPVIKEANPETAKNHYALPVGETLIIPGITDRLLCIRDRVKPHRSDYLVFSMRDCADTAEPPYLRPPSPPRQNTILRNLCTSLDGLDLARLAVSTDSFALSWEPEDPDDINKPEDVIAVFTMNDDTIWRADDASKDAVHADFMAFCAEVEALARDEAALLLPGTAHLLRQRLAELLPAHLVDSQFFRSGLNPGYGEDNSPYIDLLPGMRLRVEFTSYQAIPGAAHNGPASSAAIPYTIRRNRDGRISFDPFLSTISAPQIQPTVVGGSKLGAGVIDLHAAGTARRHYRLFYPTGMPDAATGEAANVARRVTLIGADTLTDLLTATKRYTEDGEIATGDLGNLPIVGFSFRGRAIAVPEIPVSVNNVETFVPVGTTVRDILDTTTPAWNPVTLHGTDQFAMERLFLGTDGLPRYHDVRFDPGDPFDPAVYDLPLALGDRLSIAWPVG